MKNLDSSSCWGTLRVFDDTRIQLTGENGRESFALLIRRVNITLSFDLSRSINKIRFLCEIQWLCQSKSITEFIILSFDSHQEQSNSRKELHQAKDGLHY